MMIKILDTTNNLFSIYENGNFNFDKWKNYIDDVMPSFGTILIDDMNNTINNCGYSYEKDYLPILNEVYLKQDKVNKTIDIFKQVTNDLENIIEDKFKRAPNVNIILYMGLCNGAGWAIKHNNENFILLGIEKIIELKWYDTKSMCGLIYHELGHIYQQEFGVLDRDYKGKDYFLWLLFTEGIAMYFEQVVVGDRNFFHQDNDGWLIKNKENTKQIITDFNNDLSNMSIENQRYFGDWVNYDDRGDVGYYIGSIFIWWLSDKYSIDEMINGDIEFVLKWWIEFVKTYK